MLKPNLLTTNGVLTLARKDIECEGGCLQVECIWNIHKRNSRTNTFKYSFSWFLLIKTCVFEVGLEYWPEIQSPGSATSGHTVKTDITNQSTGPYEYRNFWRSRRPEAQPDKGPYSLFKCLSLTVPFTPFPPSASSMPSHSLTQISCDFPFQRPCSLRHSQMQGNTRLQFGK